MKKVIFLVSVCFTAGALMLSCQKETVKPTAHTAAAQEKDAGYGTDGRMLIFNSVAAYESVVNDPSEAKQVDFLKDIAQLGYTSYADYLAASSETETDAVGDDFLSKMLNKDRIVQIGGYLYHVNILKQQVFVLSAAKIADYKDLAMENTANVNVSVYSTEEDVIELVENGFQTGEKGLCFESYANARNESRTLTVTVNSAIYHTFNCEVRYYAGGLIFNLKSQILAQTHYLDIKNQWKVKGYELMTKIDSYRRYKKRCENENSWYSFSGSGFTGYDANAINVWTPFKLHSYQGSKGLKKYTLESNFWYKDGNGNWNSAWNGANMYSGYHGGVSYGY
jgi:hypothetical protein